MHEVTTTAGRPLKSVGFDTQAGVLVAVRDDDTTWHHSCPEDVFTQWQSVGFPCGVYENIEREYPGVQQ